MTNQNGNSRSTFSGKMGYVLAVAGSAVGLGNIWRFPYLAAEYGGGIFLLTYLLLAVTFGYTMIVSETADAVRERVRSELFIISGRMASLPQGAGSMPSFRC